ncbi:MAG: DUF5698 domain-containing protein [Elusimicrobiota bacterium]
MEGLDVIFAGPWGPVIIFFLRIIDVSLGTTRTLLMVRNARTYVPLIAIIEITIWAFAAGNAIRNLNSFWHVLAYSGGFTAGNMIGMWIEDKLAFGYSTVRIITQQKHSGLSAALRDIGWGVTEIKGHGKDGPVDVLLTVVKRGDTNRLYKEIERHAPEAFVSTEETRAITRGWLSNQREA